MAILDVQVTRSRAYGVVRPRGELDIAGMRALAAGMSAARSATSRVVVDLQDLEFIDSSGLRILHVAHVAAQRDGWRLHLVAGTPLVQRVFELTGTRATFEWIAPEQLA